MKYIVPLFLFCSTVSAALPTAQPVSSIVVTSCHEVVGVIMVMPDGEQLTYDKDSKEDVEDVKKKAESSKKLSVYEVGCYRLDPIQV